MIAIASTQTVSTISHSSKMLTLVIAAIGLCLGRLAAGWAASMLDDMNHGGLVRCKSCQRPVSWQRRWLSLMPIRCNCDAPTVVRWHLASAVFLGSLFAGFSWLLMEQGCQSVHEVRPDGSLAFDRLPFHLTLIFLLWVATLTDLLDYVIADDVIYIGIGLALVSAFASGELQTIHIWVNWDDAVEGLRGPYLPEWMKNHQHLHGLAWSIAGLVAGAAVTWLVRFLSGLILGHPALGFGDVTLMAMIGSFLGWQPALCVLAIAPLTSIVIGIVVRFTTGKSYVAYGPYLACSAVIVMCTWRWLWQDWLSLRDIFSHWPTVAGLVGFSLVTLTILLVLVRVFRAVPVDRIRR